MHLVASSSPAGSWACLPEPIFDRPTGTESSRPIEVVNHACRACGMTALSPSIKSKKDMIAPPGEQGYDAVLTDVVHVVEAARSAAARSVNAVMTATYWAIGRRIVVAEQRGQRRAEYGVALVERKAADLTAKCGRGFGKRNLFQMRSFYLAYPEIMQTASAQLDPPGGTEILQTPSAQSASLFGTDRLARFALPWSHYVRLLAVTNPEARRFYETEALRGGWDGRTSTPRPSSWFCA